MSMRAQSAALIHVGKLKFWRGHCAQCDDVKLFRGLKCLSCGWMKPPFVRPTLTREESGMRARKFQKLEKVKKWDRIRYYQRKAAESRAKFEGT